MKSREQRTGRTQWKAEENSCTGRRKKGGGDVNKGHKKSGCGKAMGGGGSGIEGGSEGNPLGHGNARRKPRVTASLEDDESPKLRNLVAKNITGREVRGREKKGKN